MNENEIMVNEEIEENPTVEGETVENNGFGLGVIVGGLLTVAGIAIGKKVKKVIDKRKAEKNGYPDEDEIEVDDFEVQENPKK